MKYLLHKTVQDYKPILESITERISELKVAADNAQIVINNTIEAINNNKLTEIQDLHHQLEKQIFTNGPEYSKEFDELIEELDDDILTPILKSLN